MTLTLYAHPLSSYCQKALIGLYELDLPFEFRFLGPDDPATFGELLRLWPIGKFPLLVDDGIALPEASLILEHLDERHAPGRLVPADPAERMEMRLIDRVIDNYVATPQQKTIADRMRPEDKRDPHGVDEAHALLEKSYTWLDQRLAGRAWAAGERFTLADCGAAPMLFYADWVHPFGDRFPTLSAYLERLRSRPAVQRAFDEAKPYRHMVLGGIPAHVV